MFIGIIFTYCVPFFIGEFLIYINRTKISRLKYTLIFIILIILLLNNIGSSYILIKSKKDLMLDDEQINELNDIKKIIDKDCSVLTLPNEGSLFYYFTSCRVLSNNNFMFIENPNKFYEDLNDMYKKYSIFEFLALTDKYRINYIYFSKRAKDKFGIDEPNVIKLEKKSGCFEDVLDNKLFKVKCKLRKFKLEHG